MTLRIALDAGHGGGGVTPGKRSPAGEYEWDFNDAVVDGIMEEAANYENVEILRVDDDNPSDGYTDVALSKRVRMANNWNADLYISIHHNAFQSKWGNHGGTETFYYKGSSESKKLAEVVHKAMLEVYGLRDRGLKEGNWLYVLKNTKMPACLAEGGFMDSLTDIKVLRDRPRLVEAGRNIMKKIAEWKGIKRKKKAGNTGANKKPASGKTLYRVRKSWEDAKSQRGAFYNLDNAKKLADQHAGYKVFDESGKVVYDPRGEGKKTLYRVRKSWKDAKSQKGAFYNLDNAKKLADQHPGYSVYDESGKAVYTSKSSNSKPKSNKKKWTFANKTLRRGDRGEDVRKMQEGLCAAYFYPNKKAKNHGVDGIFGPNTEDAVKRFQSVYTPYMIDGIFGPKTRAALEKVLNK